MKKKSLLFSIILCFYSITLLSTEVEVKNSVLKSDKSEYHVAIKILDIENSGILKLTLTIPDEYTYNVYNNPNLLIDTRGQIVKFYTTFEAGNSIEINCKFSKKSPDNSEASIPAHIEFSINGEMVMMDKEIVLSDNEVIPQPQMDSITSHFEESSKKYENKDAIALGKMKTLSSNTPENKNNSKNEELTAMPEGYNSSTKSGLATSNKLYSVQILSLQFYNENRLNEFLSSYKLKSSDTYKKEVNGMVKIYIGKFNTYDEAKALKEKLIKQNQLTDSFVVGY